MMSNNSFGAAWDWGDPFGQYLDDNERSRSAVEDGGIELEDTAAHSPIRSTELNLTSSDQRTVFTTPKETMSLLNMTGPVSFRSLSPSFPGDAEHLIAISSNQVQPVLAQSASPSRSTYDAAVPTSSAIPLGAMSRQRPHIKSCFISDGDSDSDIELIRPETASATAQRKWRESKSLTTVTGLREEEVYIKKEPIDQSAAARTLISIFGPNEKHVSPTTDTQVLNEQTEEEVIAAQKAILSNVLSLYEQNTAEVEPNSNGKRFSRKRRRLEDPATNNENRDQIDAAMRDNEDHSWMEAPDLQVTEERDELKKRMAVFESMQGSGTVTDEHIMEYTRLQRQLRVKERVSGGTRQERQLLGGEAAVDENLFVSPLQNASDATGVEPTEGGKLPRRRVALAPPENGSADVRLPDEDEVTLRRVLEGELGNNLTTETENLGRKSKPRAKNAREYQSQQNAIREKGRKTEQNKKIRRPRGQKREAQGKMSRANKIKGKEGRKTSIDGNRKAKGEAVRAYSPPARKRFRPLNGNDELGQKILETLQLDYDPIRDRIENPIFATESEPQILGKQVKEDQFRRLYANIPEASCSRDIASDKRMLKKASLSFGYANVKAQDGKWLVKGMSSTIYHHQLLGAQWMLERELNDAPPFGGLLADTMGLGKTVQTLACMVGNPPSDQDLRSNIKATLIVVPSAVIKQWMAEIQFHVTKKVFPKVLHYQTKHNLSREVLVDLDIVITSYGEVMKQFPFPNDADRQEIAKIGHAKWFKKAKEDIGVLHQIEWYRVVLDEAHMIKNNSSRTSLACQNLKATFRWCLTGTPLLNRIDELFPYLRFLRANYTIDWEQFQRHFCNPQAEDCNNRISVLLACTMMRRTMNTTILGRPIIKLPQPHPELQCVDFSPQEKIIYRITENRFRYNLNQLFAEKAVSGNYSIFMVQLLRLRQCTSHPFMLERTIKELWTAEDVALLKSQLDKFSQIGIPFYEQCKVWVEKRVERNAFTSAIHAASGRTDIVAMPFGRSDFGHNFNLDKPMASLDEKELFTRVTCGICSDVPVSPCQTDCGHIFCKDCITQELHASASQGTDLTPCPTCDHTFKEFKDIAGGSGLVNDDEDYFKEEIGSASTAESSKGLDARGFEPKTKDSTWVTRSDYEDGFPLTPSAKTTALKATLIKGFQEAPLDKVVIYVQFRMLARIIGRICNAEGWGFLYLTGDVSIDHRDVAINMFREKPAIKILIAGLKCGGIGLNFPWANRCISLDLWWNHAVEQQAFGRIFRIGQDKETYMTRIVVNNSVDMRLLNMQKYKMSACETAMRDDDRASGKAAPNLSLKQLSQLFGFLKTDTKENIVSIEADYDDEDDAREADAEAAPDS